MRGLFEGWHIIVLALVFILLFGAKKLPESAKALAKSLKIFKSELKSDDKNSESDK